MTRSNVIREPSEADLRREREELLDRIPWDRETFDRLGARFCLPSPFAAIYRRLSDIDFLLDEGDE